MFSLFPRSCFTYLLTRSIIRRDYRYYPLLRTTQAAVSVLTLQISFILPGFRGINPSSPSYFPTSHMVDHVGTAIVRRLSPDYAHDTQRSSTDELIEVLGPL